jgi:twinkle protein
MAKGLDCKYIFLDHISILVSDQQNGDERKALDEIATKLRTLVQETGIALFMVSHLKRPGGTAHEEGGMTSLSQLRGSAGIGQLSDMVIGLERNGQHEDPIIRNTTTVRVLKNRFSGLTGPACYLYYDKDTGRMLEVDNPNDAGDDDEF